MLRMKTNAAGLMLIVLLCPLGCSEKEGTVPEGEKTASEKKDVNTTPDPSTGTPTPDPSIGKMNEDLGATLKTKFEDMARLMRAGEVDTFFSTYLPAKAQEHRASAVSELKNHPEVLMGFAQLFETAAKSTPTFNADQSEATFAMQSPQGESGELILVKEGDQWVLKDFFGEKEAETNEKKKSLKTEGKTPFEDDPSLEKKDETKGPAFP